MTTINKQKTAMLNALIHQVDTEVSRFMLAAPFISNNDYAQIYSDVSSWVTLSQSGQLYGTNEDNSTFQYDGIDQVPIYPR